MIAIVLLVLAFFVLWAIYLSCEVFASDIESAGGREARLIFSSAVFGLLIFFLFQPDMDDPTYIVIFLILWILVYLLLKLIYRSNNSPKKKTPPVDIRNKEEPVIPIPNWVKELIVAQKQGHNGIEQSWFEKELYYEEEENKNENT